MSDFVCSSCALKHPQRILTMVDGTVICTVCLKAAKESAEQNLIKSMEQIIRKDSIYD